MKHKISGMNCHYRFYDLKTFFISLQKLKIKYAEIWTCPQHFYVNHNENRSVNDLIKLSNQYGIKIQCICPEQTNPKPYNMASKDSDLKNKTYLYFKRIIDIASEIGADKIVTTSGWGYLDEPKKEAYLRSIEMQKKICEYAGRKDIKVCMEALQPIESNLINTSEQVKEYIDLVNEPALNVCIDFGAMAKSNETIQDYYKNVGGKIGHVHFVDGKPTGHLAWGDGTRDMKKDIEDLDSFGYTGYLSLEFANSLYFQEPFLADKKTITKYKEIFL